MLSELQWTPVALPRLRCDSILITSSGVVVNSRHVPPLRVLIRGKRLWMQILEYMQIEVIDKRNQCMFGDSSIWPLEIIQIGGDLCRALDFKWGCSLLLWSFACYLS
jgi:hypothetical protein